MNNKLDIHGFCANLHKANKYFQYYKELLKDDYAQALDKYPLIADARQSFYFRTVLYLCNFFKGGLRLGKLVDLASDPETKKQVSEKVRELESDPDYKSLFNLRDKWIAHQDPDWYKSSQVISDTKLQYFLDSIGVALQNVGVIPPLPNDQDLKKSKDFLNTLKNID